MLLLAIDFDNLHQILQNLYVEMMPLCSKMTGVARGLAGLGALFYVAYRVWQALARAEPVDVFPLLRPFALGLCIMFFPTLVLGTLNSILSPVVKGTHTILESQTFDMNEYRCPPNSNVSSGLPVLSGTQRLRSTKDTTRFLLYLQYCSK